MKLIDCDSTFVKIESTDFNFEVFFSWSKVNKHWMKKEDRANIVCVCHFTIACLQGTISRLAEQKLPDAVHYLWTGQPTKQFEQIKRCQYFKWWSSWDQTLYVSNTKTPCQVSNFLHLQPLSKLSEKHCFHFLDLETWNVCLALFNCTVISSNTKSSCQVSKKPGHRVTAAIFYTYNIPES